MTDLIKILRKSVYLSETFGLTSFKIKETNNKKMFYESKKRLKTVKMNFCAVLVLHLLLIFFTAEEIKLAREDVSVKIVRFVNLVAFSGGIVAMFVVVTTKGKVMCKGLNEINDLYIYLISARPKFTPSKCKNKAPLFLCTVVNYSVTVLPLMLTALYVQRNKISKIVSYSYYAYSMWLENIFVYQFVIIARFVGEVYGLVSRVSRPQLQLFTQQLLFEIRRTRKHEETVKNFIEVLTDVYKYVLFFWICWSFTMILQFVLKVNLRIRVVIWCFFISVRAMAIIYGCNIIKNEVLLPVLSYIIGLTFLTSFYIFYMHNYVAQFWLRAEETAENLSELFIAIDDLEIKEEIEIYSYQLLHRKPNFSALGFFTLDYPLFHSVVASVATYIVILSQLRGASEASHKYLNFSYSIHS